MLRQTQAQSKKVLHESGTEIAPEDIAGLEPKDMINMEKNGEETDQRDNENPIDIGLPQINRKGT